MLTLDNRKTQALLKGKLMRRINFFQSGLTLIELLISVIIIGVLAGFAAPAFNSMIMASKSNSVAEELVSALAASRAEAVSRRQSVSICRSEDGATCSEAGDWRVGFIMYTDTESETSADTTPGTVIRHWTDIPPRSLISLTRDAVDVNFIRYTSMGTLARVDNSPAVFTVRVEGCEATDNQRRILVALSGIHSVTREVCPE